MGTIALASEMAVRFRRCYRVGASGLLVDSFMVGGNVAMGLRTKLQLYAVRFARKDYPDSVT